MTKPTTIKKKKVSQKKKKKERKGREKVKQRGLAITALEGP